VGPLTNPNKAKGDQFERDVRDYLLDRGIATERIPAGARKDRSDLWLPPPGAVIQCKNRKTIELAGWVDEMEKQRANTGRPLGFVAIKRRGKAVDGAYLVTTLELGWRILEGRWT
jgi:Holliday junction resolvase